MTTRQPRSRHENAEGQGIARARWFRFLSELDPDMLDITGLGRRNTIMRSSAISDDDRKRIERYARDFSEMVGFWITWHSLGGFDRLEDNGWHRATIYRKIKKFREFFDAHPDEYEFDWIQLDLEKSWVDELNNEFVGDRPEPDGGDS